jgi:hypothetical protein
LAAACFADPGQCCRSGISYNAGLGRYLWWQQKNPSSRSRYEGGMGVFDAPEPWGPWTTVYLCGLWDIGPGETASFPPKWMSEDGRTCWLVFSGDDTLALRRVRFETY